jgi:hypothetical protein
MSYLEIQNQLLDPSLPSNKETLRVTMGEVKETQVTIKLTFFHRLVKKPAIWVSFLAQLTKLS